MSELAGLTPCSREERPGGVSAAPQVPAPDVPPAPGAWTAATAPAVPVSTTGTTAAEAAATTETNRCPAGIWPFLYPSRTGERADNHRHNSPRPYDIGPERARSGAGRSARPGSLC